MAKFISGNLYCRWASFMILIRSIRIKRSFILFKISKSLFGMKQRRKISKKSIFSSVLLRGFSNTGKIGWTKKWRRNSPGNMRKREVLILTSGYPKLPNFLKNSKTNTEIKCPSVTKNNSDKVNLISRRLKGMIKVDLRFVKNSISLYINLEPFQMPMLLLHNRANRKWIKGLCLSKRAFLKNKNITILQFEK